MFWKILTMITNHLNNAKLHINSGEKDLPPVPFEDLLTSENVQEVMRKKGYNFFTGGIYNLNLIGVRRGTTESNKFDDYLLVVYKDQSLKWVRAVYPITTDPGKHWLLNPLNKEGTAILVPGQYRSTWKLGKHKGRYEALCQRKPVKVWRDNNKDRILDFYSSPEDEGYFGINIHRSNPYTESEQVDKWSAGCQVFKKVDDFNEFMESCRNSSSLYGDSFTYTLLEEQDFRSL